MIESFDENRPEFKGFNKFYNSDIAPYLESREVERKVAVAKGRKTGIMVALGGFAIALYAFTRQGSWPVLGVISAISIGAGFIIASSIANKIKGEIKSFLLEHICAFMGLAFTEKDFDAPDLTVWIENKLLPRYDRASFEDRMSGESYGAHFELCEAHMEKESTDKDGDTQWSTVFRGIVLEVDFHREFLGRTIVVRDAGIFNSKKKNGMKRVGLADPVFEKIFEAYGTDQVEARYLLTPDFMQRLVDLENSVSGKKIRFGFLYGKLHIAIEISNQFEIDSMMHSLLDGSRTEKILSEIGAIFDVIDGAIKPLENRR